MGRYNPNYPTVLGNELAPVALDPVSIDTASAFGYTFPTIDTTIRTARVLMTAPPPGQARRKVLTVEVYRDEDAPSTGRMHKILIPVTTGASVAGVSLTGGAASFADALNNPTDLKGILFTGPSAAARLWFDTSTSNTKLHSLLLNARIMDVTVRYAVAGQFNLYNNPVSLSLERPAAANILLMDDALVGGTSIASGTVPRRSRLGDYNPFWNTTINPSTDMRRAPWTARNTGAGVYTGLEAMQATGGNNLNVRIDTIAGIAAAANAFTLHYCALEVTYCAEGRVAAGGFDLTTGVSIDSDLFYVDVPMFSIISGNGFNWASTSARSDAAVIGQAVIGATSQTFPMPVSVDRLVPSRDTFRGHKGIVLRKTIRDGEEWTREDEESIPAIGFYTSTTVFDATTIVVPSSQVYVAQLANQAGTISAAQYALIIDDVAGLTYTHLRFYARRNDSTDTELYIRQTDSSNIALGPQVVLSIEEFDALPEIADGWKEVTLALSAPVVSTGSGTFRWSMESTTQTQFPWEVLGADANPYRETTGAYDAGTYGGATAFARVNAANDLSADMSLTMIQAMPVPANFAVAPAVQSLEVVDEDCGLPVEAIPTGINYFTMSWAAVNTVAVAGFGFYEIQRRDTTMPSGVWETVVEATQVTTITAADYEARVGVETRYRLRTVHEDGYTSAWTAEVPVTIAAPGVTGTGVAASVLILTSNHDPDMNLAYVMSWDGGGVPDQEFTYPEAGTVEFREMYGRDYRVAFHGTERGGVIFTRTLLLNALGAPAGTLDTNAGPLRDLAWAALPYVCVRDERHNRWLSNMSVPSSAARDVPSAGHLVVAPVTFTEVTATPAPVDYSDTTCEGLLREEGVSTRFWETPPPASMFGTRTITDTFTRTVGSGWGTPDLGGATTATGGSATDFNVNGTQGTILTGTTAVDRRVMYAAVLGPYTRNKIEFIVPAVATVATYTVAMIVRYQDASNMYLIRPTFKTTGQFSVDIVKIVAGVSTTLVTGVNIDSYTVGTRVILEAYVQGARILARAYRTGDPLPDWTDTSGEVVAVADTSLAIGGRFGVQQTRQAGNTNATLTIAYDSFTVDTIPFVYDFRALVRPISDDWGAGFALEPFGVDMEGGWGYDVTSQAIQFLAYGRGFTAIETTLMELMRIVKNRLTWFRLLVTPDNGSGVFTIQFYTLADDNVTWTLIDTKTQALPNQPMEPAPPDTTLSVSGWEGQIWVHKWEVRIDNVLVVSPDFAAQTPGTTAFLDAQGNSWTTDGEGICADLV